MDQKAVEQLAKAKEAEQAVGLVAGGGGNRGEDSDFSSDDSDDESLDEHGNPKPKRKRKKHGGSGEDAVPTTLNVATLTAHFIIDP